MAPEHHAQGGTYSAQPSAPPMPHDSQYPVASEPPKQAFEATPSAGPRDSTPRPDLWTRAQHRMGRFLLTRLINIFVAIVLRTVGTIFTITIPLAAGAYFLANKEPAPALADDAGQRQRWRRSRPVTFLSNVYQIWRMSRRWRIATESYIEARVADVIFGTVSTVRGAASRRVQ